MSEFYEDIWEQGDLRVRITPDLDSSDLWSGWEHLGVFASTSSRGHHDTTVASLYYDDHEVESVGDFHKAVCDTFKATTVLFLRNRYDGGYDVVELPSDQRMDDGVNLDAVIFDTPHTREECGTPVELIEQALRDEVDEYTKWARGDVWGAVLERKVVWTTDSEGFPPKTTWEQMESVWGLIGNEYAHEAALDYFPKGETA